jgi:hypothetical protein
VIEVLIVLVVRREVFSAWKSELYQNLDDSIDQSFKRRLVVTMIFLH